jgi:hypothetical protein
MSGGTKMAEGSQARRIDVDLISRFHLLDAKFLDTDIQDREGVALARTDSKR